jgi:hypothetical protein
VGDEPLGRRSFEKRIRAQFVRGELLGEIRRPEGANPVTFQNALDMLARRGCLRLADAPAVRERRREVGYARGPAFDELAALRERLATALSAG